MAAADRWHHVEDVAPARLDERGEVMLVYDMQLPMTPAGTPEARYAEVTERFLSRDNVNQAGKGFGSSALKIGGHIFAMLTARSEFVVKLPRERVVQLIESGDGRPYDAGKGRPMKEWVVIRPESSASWISLAEEALTFAAWTG